MIPKVLFVDDDAAVLGAIKAMVEPLGYEVLTLADSQLAGERLKKEKFDAVFVDARMPHPDGFELTQTIRRSPLNSSVPVVMLTGYNEVDVMRKAFQAGITFFLWKPVNQDGLAKLLRAMRDTMLREHRRYMRLPYRTTVTCRLGGRSFKAECGNLGEGGMLLEASGGAEVDQELDLQFSVPEAARPLRPHAKVVRKEAPDRIAVQFVGLDADEQKAIRNYIAGRASA